MIKNEHINNNNHLAETENEAKDKCFEELTKRMAANEKKTATATTTGEKTKQTQFGPPVDIDCYYVLLLLRSYMHMMKIADNSHSSAHPFPFPFSPFIFLARSLARSLFQLFWNIGSWYCFWYWGIDFGISLVIVYWLM